MMFKILDKKDLNPAVVFMKIKAPHVVENAAPGQFIVIRATEKGERVPLTIFDTDKKEGSVSVIFQKVGKTTYMLSELGEAGSVEDVIGPLGRPTAVFNAGAAIFIGGGVGAAEVYPVAKAFKEAGADITAIIGARSKELLVLVDEMKVISRRVYVTTDDGSAGQKGLVTDGLKGLLESERPSYVYAAGPILMMRAVAELTRGYGVKTIVSLNANMVDATGMCGTCRVTIGGRMKFSCVDGPEFNGHKVDFVELINRDRRFKEEEAESLKLYEKTSRKSAD